MSTVELSKFISSEDDVFTINNLPEEVIAVLIAKYSRSPKSLRDVLAEMLDADEYRGGEEGKGEGMGVALEKARKFHEKYVVGYGHGSVAENAVIHMGVENVSILAAKALEDARIGASFTEKSTRYVVFNSGSFVTPPELDPRFMPELHRRYVDECNRLIDTYLLLVGNVTHTIMERHTKPDGMTPGVYSAMVRARALDLCRGLLPASTTTNLGMTINARAMELLLSKLHSHPAMEMRKLANPMHREALIVAPTLVKYASPSTWRSALKKPTQIAPTIFDQRETYRQKLFDDRRNKIQLRTDVNMNDAKRRVAAALLWETNGPDIATSHRLGYEEINAVIEQSLTGRTSHERAPRAFETINAQIELLADFGCFRDLQRHRMVAWFGRELTADLGFEIPEGLAELGGHYVDRYAAAMKGAAHVWSAMRAAVGEWAAQYVVPIGYNYHVLANTNLRELFHLVELRSGKGGHLGYRRIAQELHRKVAWHWPWAAEHMRCDHNTYEFARD